MTEPLDKKRQQSVTDNLDELIHMDVETRAELRTVFQDSVDQTGLFSPSDEDKEELRQIIAGMDSLIPLSVSLTKSASLNSWMHSVNCFSEIRKIQDNLVISISRDLLIKAPPASERPANKYILVNTETAESLNDIKSGSSSKSM